MHLKTGEMKPHMDIEKYISVYLLGEVKLHHSIFKYLDLSATK